MRLYTMLGRDHTTLLYAARCRAGNERRGLEESGLADAVVRAAPGSQIGRLPGRGNGSGSGRLPVPGSATPTVTSRATTMSLTVVFVIRPRLLGIAARASSTPTSGAPPEGTWPLLKAGAASSRAVAAVACRKVAQ